MAHSCAFCDRKNFEERIIKETDHFFVIASLGQISDGGHLLVIPKRHMMCLGEAQEMPSLKGIVADMRRALACVYERGPMSQRWSVMAFEHGIVGQSVFHAHLHLLPARLFITDKVREDFPDSEIQTMPEGDTMQELYLQRPEPYLYWMTPNGKEMVCWNPPASPRYFRELFAERLGHPERADWQKVDREHDRMLWSSTVALLKSHLLP